MNKRHQEEVSCVRVSDIPCTHSFPSFLRLHRRSCAAPFSLPLRASPVQGQSLAQLWVRSTCGLGGNPLDHQVETWYLQTVKGRADHPGGLGLASQLKWKEILVSFDEARLWRCCSAKPRERQGERRGENGQLTSLRLALTSHPTCFH